MENNLHRNGLTDLWIKSSVVGCFWAANEIVTGGILHNLKIPMAGTFLTLISIVWLVGFLQIWPEKGLIYRAGLICAFMRSFSSSAFLFGPMIGIFTVAIIIECFIFLLGNNIFSYVIGGACAAFSALVHKILHLLIVFGFDFVKIISNLFYFFKIQFNISDFDLTQFIIILSVMYLVSGCIAAIMGYYLGKKAKNTNSYDLLHIQFSPLTKMHKNLKSKKSKPFLIVAFYTGIVVCLFLLYHSSIYIALPIIIFLLLLTVFYYKNSLKHLKKTWFWIQLVIIIALSGLFWNRFDNYFFIDSEGIKSGLMMNFRAFILMIGFSALSVEIKNPVANSLKFHKSFRKLYTAINIAFSALPSLLEKMQMQKKFFNPFNLIVLSIKNAENIYLQFRIQSNNLPEIIVVTGTKHCGKTSYVKQIIENEKDKKYIGFLSNAIFEKEKRIGYELINIQNNESIELCSIYKNEDRLFLGNYYFNHKAFEFGNSIFSEKNINNAEAIVIDEIGLIELNNSGWADLLSSLLLITTKQQIWVIREQLVDNVLSKWNVMPSKIIKVNEI